MIKKRFIATARVSRLVFILAAALSLAAADRHMLIVNGQFTDVPVIFVKSEPYVELKALANTLNGSVSSSGPKVALSLPANSPNCASSPTAAQSASEPAPVQPVAHAPSFSREFLNAGIEEMSSLREWHTALQTAIQNGIPLSEGLLQPYRMQATKNLRLTSVAATSPADRDGYDLLNNVHGNMQKLSDKYVGMRANLSYIAPDALQNDELNQRIVTCGRFLGAMAASGQFSDDGSCH